MTPRESAIAALEMNPPRRLVPHMELEFQLCEDLFGSDAKALCREHVGDVTGTRRQDLLKRNAEMWVRVADRFNYYIITGLHSLDPMAGVDIAEVKQLCGDRICLLGNVNMAWLQRRTPQQIQDSYRYCLEHRGVEQGGYIFATSNCIFEGVPLGNYELMLELRQRYGYAGRSPWAE